MVSSNYSLFANMQGSMNEAQLLTALANGATAITPNRRLANVWQARFAEHQTAVWAKPHIHALGDWFNLQWDALCLLEVLPIRCDQAQQTWLWQSIIQADDEGLMDVYALTQTAISAWQLCQKWRVKNFNQFNETEESRAFYRWMKQYQAQCQQMNICDNGAMLDYLMALWPKHPTLPKHIICLGFMEFTPQEDELFEFLKQQSLVETYEPPVTDAEIVTTSALDAEAELTAMAHWARQLSQQGVAPIACVTQDPSAARIFRDVFKSNEAFNLSASKSLAKIPIISTALALLSIEDPIEMHQLNQVLNASHTSLDSIDSAKAYAQCREQGLAEMPLNQCQAYFPEEAISRLNTMKKQQQSGLAWANTFADYLNAWGWPGKQLNPEDNQAFERFKNCLNQCAKLDLFSDHHSFSQAKSFFELLINQTLFHQASPDAPVQVLGVLEASGQSFAAIWSSAMNNTQWPPAPRLNPLLPYGLQKQQQMPHTSAKRELDYCRQLIQGFCDNAPTVIFSYAETDVVSTLLNFKTVTLASLVDIPSHQPTQKLEAFSDPAIPIQDGETIHGGSRLLQLQAACPFRAFAELRLNAEPLAGTVIGIDAIDRGSIVHRALELIWQQLKDHATLTALNSAQRQNLCQKMAKQVMKSYFHERPKSQTIVLQQLEQERLTHLLMQWLDYETERPPFKVCAIEKSIEIDIAGTVLNCRIDRIDELDDGSKILIDYKTGRTSISDWFGERPSAPQLPLYAISQAEILAIAFAQVRVDECRLNGVSGIDTLMPELKIIGDMAEALSWDELITLWEHTLSELIQEFREGEARVDPKDATTCQTCALPTFCRIHELA